MKKCQHFTLCIWTIVLLILPQIQMPLSLIITIITGRLQLKPPDSNPIELVWHDLKVYLSTECKPNTIAELIAGIKLFWRTVVTVDYCNSKINHVKNKVIYHAIRVQGKATGL